MNRDFWRHKKVFITGHTGFKGTWLTLIMKELGCIIKGFSLPKTKEDNSFFNSIEPDLCIESSFGDIRDYKFLEEEIIKFKPDVVFHLAAQPLVRDSYEDPLKTIEVNVIGTANILNICRNISGLKCVINVTSDKCYQNLETGREFQEDDPMGGNDPYSCSKGCAELVSSSFYKSFYEDSGISLCSVRAGNVIGGGDYSVDRLVPDILKSYNEKINIKLRNPYAIRPWQHVIEPLNGYIILAEKASTNGNYSGGWNFGPTKESFQSVEWITKELFKRLDEDYSKIEIENDEDMPESQILKLSIKKAVTKLGWKPALTLQNSLDLIISWNKAWNSKENMYNFSKSQIHNYLSRKVP